MTDTQTETLPTRNYLRPALWALLAVGLAAAAVGLLQLVGLVPTLPDTPGEGEAGFRLLFAVIHSRLFVLAAGIALSSSAWTALTARSEEEMLRGVRLAVGSLLFFCVPLLYWFVARWTEGLAT